MKLSRKEQLLYIFIITLGIILRWYQLGDRPFHHDESLHGIYGLYYFTNPEHQFYRYDPMLHGPFLYHLLPLFYKLLGVSKASARSLGTLLGSLWIFIPMLFHRYLSRRAVLVATAYIALSPTLIYWSRFIRHDSIFLSLCFLALITVYVVKSVRFKVFLLPITLALLFCTKENAYLMLVLLLVNILYELIAYKVHPLQNPTILGTAKYSIKKYPLMFFNGLVVSCLAYTYFYSGGFRYIEGIWDGLFRKSLSYWFHQHQIERISGPFSFQFFVLSWYEALFVILAILQVILLFKQSAKWYRLSILSVLALSLLFYFLNSYYVIDQSFFLAKFLKLKIPVDYLISFIILALGLLNTTMHWLRNERTLSIASYWFFACFFSYSYVGEKVPWLSLYPLCFGIIYLSLFYSPLLAKIKTLYFNIIFTTMCLFLGYQSLLTNFFRAGKNSEILSQVHTTKEYEDMLMQIKKNVLEAPFKQKKPPRILSYKENTWPSFWYFYGMPEYQFYLGNNRLSDFDYILTTDFDPYTEQQLVSTHFKMKFPLRGWWQPNYRDMSLSNFLSYAFTHKPWANTGQQMITVFSKHALNK